MRRGFLTCWPRAAAVPTGLPMSAVCPAGPGVVCVPSSLSPPALPAFMSSVPQRAGPSLRADLLFLYSCCGPPVFSLGYDVPRCLVMSAGGPHFLGCAFKAVALLPH